MADKLRCTQCGKEDDPVFGSDFNHSVFMCDDCWEEIHESRKGWWGNDD